MSGKPTGFNKDLRTYAEKSRSFYGGVDEDPLSWLREFTRLKECTNAKDSEMSWIMST
jgi:hypothetical protein